MNQQKDRRVLIVASLVILAIIIGVWLALGGKFGNSYDPTAAREPESDGPKILVLKNSEELAKALLPAQYDKAKAEITSFVNKYVDINAKSASVVGNIQKPNGGTVIFKLAIEGRGEIYTINIDRWTYYDKLVITIPEKNFSTVVQVYNN